MTAGYIHAEPRRAFYEKMDAANDHLEGFTGDFYEICGGHLQPVLDTLEYLVKETSVWTEITTLLIYGENDSDRRSRPSANGSASTSVPTCRCIRLPSRLEDDRPGPRRRRRSPARCTIAQREGLHYVYTGNVHDQAGGSTYCPSCGEVLVARDWYNILGYRLTDEGACRHCGTRIAGRFQKFGKPFGPRRIPVRLQQEKRFSEGWIDPLACAVREPRPRGHLVRRVLRGAAPPRPNGAVGEGGRPHPVGVPPRYLASLFIVGFIADHYGAKRAYITTGIAAVSPWAFVLFADGFGPPSGCALTGLCQGRRIRRRSR